MRAQGAGAVSNLESEAGANTKQASGVARALLRLASFPLRARVASPRAACLLHSEPAGPLFSHQSSPSLCALAPCLPPSMLLSLGGPKASSLVPRRTHTQPPPHPIPSSLTTVCCTVHKFFSFPTPRHATRLDASERALPFARERGGPVPLARPSPFVLTRPVIFNVTHPRSAAEPKA